MLSSLRVCLSVASQPYLRVSEAKTTKLDTVTASVMRMHHVLIVLTFTFIQDHTDLDRENNSLNVRLFHKLFKQCPSSLLKVRVYNNLCQSEDLPSQT